MEIPACCPHCDSPFIWELNFSVDRELAWAAPNGPSFVFRCATCEKLLGITFHWHLEKGAAPRHLKIVGGKTTSASELCILLVDSCPHGCGAKLGLQLPPTDPWTTGRVWPDEPRVLGGYRCPRCDGEGRLRIWPVIEGKNSAH